MISKNKKSPTVAERAHKARVKELPCSVCDTPGPSSAHHIDQNCEWTLVALCYGCHQGRNGLHGGTRAIWKIKKMNEVDALGVTIMRLMK